MKRQYQCWKKEKESLLNMDINGNWFILVEVIFIAIAIIYLF